MRALFKLELEVPVEVHKGSGTPECPSPLHGEPSAQRMPRMSPVHRKKLELEA
jgi:hypothetical protein